MSNSRIKMRIFDFLALGFNLGLAINLVIIFFCASFNGGEITITVDQYSEQTIEMIFFPVFVIMGVVTLVRLGNKIRTRGQTTEEKKKKGRTPINRADSLDLVNLQPLSQSIK
jgi:Na+(H+)/acetate symporter ActP